MTNRPAKEAAAYLSQKFNVDFGFNGGEVTMHSMNKSITQFLYYLIDMHVNAKRHIKSPQSKLLDFINRLKVSYEYNDERTLPYSF